MSLSEALLPATLSQGTRRTGLRRSRYTGLAKTHLQHILIATALNLVRLDARFNDVPIAKTRVYRSLCFSLKFRSKVQ